MKKVTVCVLMLVLVMALGFAQGSKGTTTRPDVVKLQVWYAIGGASGEKFVSLANAFDAARSDIELELTYSGNYADTATKVSAAMISGNAPDVAIMAAGQLYTGGRGDYSMETLVKDPAFDVNDIFKGMLEYGMFEGRVASVPYGVSSQVLYYNKDITDKAGLDLEKNPPATWAEFSQVAKTAKEKGNTNKSSDFYGFDTSDGVWLFKTMLGQNGNEVVQKREDKVVPVFQESSGVEVANFWKSLIDAQLMPASQHNIAEKKFLAGNLAFIAASSNRVSRWQGNTSFNLGAIMMPGFKNRSIALGGNVGVILTGDTYKSEASWELLKYLLEEKNHTDFALTTGYLPVRKSALENQTVKEAFTVNPLYKIAFDQLDDAWAYYHFAEMGTMDSFFWYALDELEKNVLTPQAALEKAAASLVKEIQ